MDIIFNLYLGDIMEFKDALKDLSNKINKIKDHIHNEEMTKHSLILPFINLLGYNIFNPLEVRPEYTADYGIKKGEKVDYALLNDGKPILFLEAKSVNESLYNHDSQLARYFITHPNVKVAILTNGINYKFFVDLEHTNLMDRIPFFEFDITNLRDSDFEIIENFRKEKYDNDSIRKLAKELKHKSVINKKLRELLKEPNENFIRFLIKECGFNESDELIEDIKPIIKKSINDIFYKENDLMNNNNNNNNIPKVNNSNVSNKINDMADSLDSTLFDNYDEDSIFYIFRKGNKMASGILLDSNEFKVFKGSKAVLEEKKSGKGFSKLRKKLIDLEILKKYDDNHYIFTKDYIFNTPSQASGVIMGASLNGWIEWKNNKNETLDKVYRK